MSNSRDQLLQDVETFLAVRGMKATDFGLQAVNDGRFVHELRLGRNVRMGTYDRVRTFMREYGRSEPKEEDGRDHHVAA